jgi:PAS domain S-box-containing protein
LTETTAVNRAGKAFPVEFNLSPFRVDKKWFAVGTVRDITQRKQMDETLKKSKEALQTQTEALQNQVGELGKTRKAMLNILEDLDVSRKEAEATIQKIDAMSQAVNDALIMIDGRGKVLFWNQAAEKLFGYSAAEAMGRDFHEIATQDEVREKALAGVKTFAETGQGPLFGAARETTAVNRAGMTFPVEINLSPFRLDGKWFAVGTVRDITERKQAEKDLKERMDDLERFSRLTINREEKMIRLKEEINALLEQSGRENKYKIVS